MIKTNKITNIKGVVVLL